MPSDTQPKYAVHTAAFCEAIYVGKLDSAGTALLDKEEVTDMVLAAVARYVREHFAGALAMDFISKRASRSSPSPSQSASTTPAGL